MRRRQRRWREHERKDISAGVDDDVVWHCLCEFCLPEHILELWHADCETALVARA